MKKFNFSIVTLLAVAMMFVFASCTKDGVYKPKKKISKIYQTVLTDPVPEKVLIESWTWDGKLLSKIDYGDGDIAYFNYEKNQLKSITMGDNRTEITYNGKLVETMKVYSKDELEDTYTFQHEKNLISGYTVESEGNKVNKAKIARLTENAFRFIAPEVAKNEAACYLKMADSSLKGKTTRTVTYKYDGKNVVEAKSTYGNSSVTYTYTYTEYLNLFYNSLYDMDFSKNAPATCMVKDEDLPDYNYTYTYKVDGKFPTQAIVNLKWSIGSMSYNQTVQTDYEFVK